MKKNPLHDPEYRKFLERLKDARKAAGLSQMDVANKLKRPQSFVAKSESGERRVDVIELKRFAEVYGMRVGDFV